MKYESWKWLCPVLFLLLFQCNLMADDSVHQIKEIAEWETLQKSDKPIVVDFFATWCGPCHMLAPVLKELADEYGEKVTFVKVDVDQFGDLAKEHQVNGIPDVRIFQNSKQVEQLVGFQPKKNYQKVIDALLD